MIKGLMILISLMTLSILPKNAQAQAPKELKESTRAQSVSKIQKNKKAVSKWSSNYRPTSRVLDNGNDKSMSDRSDSSNSKDNN